MAKRWESDSKVPGLCISRGQSWVFRYGLNGRWDRQLKLGGRGADVRHQGQGDCPGRLRVAVLAGRIQLR